LRERGEDIPLLIDYFVEKKSRELKLPVPPTLKPGTLEVLKAYHWPGNVRELENLVERALILNRLSEKPAPLSFEGLFFPKRDKRTPRQFPEDHEIRSLDEAARAHILRALSVTNGKIFGPGGAAELLRINPHTLLGRMRKLGMKGKVRRSWNGTFPSTVR
jgi:DNA-binding NtrC family response regulator